MIKYMTGDVFTTEKEYIGHGVNVDGVMGSGIAVRVRKDFPENYRIYREACKNGTLKPGMVLPHNENGKTILNIASQDRPGANARMEWLEEGIIKCLLYCMANKIDGMAIPRIGAGIGGLVWEDVDEMLNEVFSNVDVELEIWTYPENIVEDDNA